MLTLHISELRIGEYSILLSFVLCACLKYFMGVFFNFLSGARDTISLSQPVLCTGTPDSIQTISLLNKVKEVEKSYNDVRI